MQAIKASDVRTKTKSQHVFPLILLLLVVLIFFSIVYSLINGQANISMEDVFQILLTKISGGRLGSLDGITSNSAVNIIWFVRTPRVILAVFVGMGLAITGA